NKDLEEEVQKGRFREDLYWRLKIISIDLPPLRSRDQDIPELVEYFVHRFSLEYSKPVRHVSESALERLAAYSWPGNVRELENCIRRAVLLCNGEVISVENLVMLDDRQDFALHGPNLESLRSRFNERLQELVAEFLQFSKQDAHAAIIELVDEAIIKKALEECGNNQVQTAKMLGISRNTLRQRIEKYLGKGSQPLPD
ncbi:MAG: helix-turn-helix domain-containing protein, partial [Desulfatibacillaceae bacterium]|nr:helix-turn-helix domain-containing protein [Desulfatibacillaceae bacterium]